MSKNRKKKFQEATEDDPELQLLKQLCKKEGEIRSIPENLKHYWNLRAEIAYEEGLLFLGERLIVPKKLREQILKDLHEGHIGIERTIRKARQALYWPKMSRDIEQHISQCPICEKFSKRNYKAPLIPHEIPEIPFSKLGADILDFAGKPYLIVVDYLSTWIEIKKLRDKSARSVNDAIKDIATTHGYPDEIVADNVPFNSAECRTFAQEHDFEFNTTSPRYPQANGMAEKAVGIAKLILRKAAEEGRDYRDLLLEHRASPMTKDNVSPAQILMSRRLKTKTPLTLKKRRPKVAENFIEAVKKQQEEAKKWYDRRARRREIAFKVGDKVVERAHYEDTWEQAEVVQVHQNPRSYIIRNKNGNLVRRNFIHLKMSKTPREENYLSPTTRRVIEQEVQDKRGQTRQEEQVRRETLQNPGEEEENQDQNEENPGQGEENQDQDEENPRQGEENQDQDEENPGQEEENQEQDEENPGQEEDGQEARETSQENPDQDHSREDQENLISTIVNNFRKILEKPQNARHQGQAAGKNSPDPGDRNQTQERRDVPEDPGAKPCRSRSGRKITKPSRLDL